MYAQNKVAERLAIAENEYGFKPEYHSVPEIDAFERHMKDSNRYILDPSAKIIGTQNLSEFEAHWIQNEQILVMCDANYFLTRYCYVKDEENIIRRFSPRVPQQILFDIIADLESMDASIEIMILKARQLGMCLDPDTEVLTSNLEWKRIRHVEVGETLISVDENPAGGKGNHRHMRRCVVEARKEVCEPAIRFTTQDGRTLYATAQHRFLCKIRGSTSTVWRTVEDMRIGDEIRWITTSWGPSTYEDGWFGGLLDGEGSLRPKSRAGSELCISQVAGPVLERARKYLDDNGYHYREEVDDREAGTSSKLGSQPVHKFVIGRMDEIFRLLGKARPSRLLAKPWWEGKELPGKKSGTGWTKIIALEKVGGTRTMIDLQTSTKTFIADGLVSHNSTLVELLIAHRIIFAYGVNAIIGSADQTKTALMANMLFLCYDHLPFWMKPEETRRVESDRGMLVFGHISSGVSFQHGAQTSGIARGTTPTIYHLSEVASFTDAVNQIEASLFKAVHASTSVFGILESTGEGDKGWWPDTWRHAKANWRYRRSRLCPLFLPWFCGVDLYPKPTWIRMRPVPDDWFPNQDTRKHVAKSELFVRGNPLLEKHLKNHQGVTTTNWKMPREQQWYWEVEHEQAKSKDIQNVFLQEMAGDDEEALQRSVESVFGHQVIEVLDDSRKRDYETYTITGQSIEDAHEITPEYYDYSKERTPVRYASKRGEVYRWEFIPLKKLDSIRETDPTDADRVLFIWHLPKPGVSYSIGVDTSEGKGEDSTVISVWTYGNKAVPDVQCAEFSSPYINHVEAFAFILSIAAFYGRFMEQGVTKWKEPYVSIEQVAAVGDTCQLQMMKMGYGNFHRFVRYDSKKIVKNKAKKLGWYTYGWSRPMLTTNFVHSVQNGWAKVNSPWLIEEMKTFEVHKTSTGKEKLEHEEGEHDDRIFAAAMAIFCPHDLDILAERSKNRMVEKVGLPPIDLGDYRSNIVSASDMRQRSTTTLQDLAYMDIDEMHRMSR